MPSGPLPSRHRCRCYPWGKGGRWRSLGAVLPRGPAWKPGERNPPESATRPVFSDRFVMGKLMLPILAMGARVIHYLLRSPVFGALPQGQHGRFRLREGCHGKDDVPHARRGGCSLFVKVPSIHCVASRSTRAASVETLCPPPMITPGPYRRPWLFVTASLPLVTPQLPVR